MSKHTNGADGVEVAGRALAENELSWDLVLGRVSDSVCLASNNTRRRVLVDLDHLSVGSSDQGGTSKNGLEETHVDGNVDIGG